jgi:hypothetical protein
LSEQGILQRYENQKADRGVERMTTPEAHKAGYDGMLQTFERIERQASAEEVRRDLQRQAKADVEAYSQNYQAHIDRPGA